MTELAAHHLARPTSLPPDLIARLEDRNVIVFDGHCILCARFFRFILARDSAQSFRFATAQSPLGQSLYRALGLPTDAFETNLVIIAGQPHQKMDAVAAAMAALPAPWPALKALTFLPKFVKDPAYSLVARNRYRIFGRTETCLIPSADIRNRFLPDGL